MPRVSDKTGFKCPRPKCGGHMRVKVSKPTKSGRIIRRTRLCPRCGLAIGSREFVPDYEQLAATLEPFSADQPQVKSPRKRQLPLPPKRKRRILAVA